MTFTNHKLNIQNKTFKKWIVTFEKSRVRLHSRFEVLFKRELITRAFHYFINAKLECLLRHSPPISELSIPNRELSFCTF